MQYKIIGKMLEDKKFNKFIESLLKKIAKEKEKTLKELGFSKNKIKNCEKICLTNDEEIYKIDNIEVVKFGKIKITGFENDSRDFEINFDTEILNNDLSYISKSE